MRMTRKDSTSVIGTRHTDAGTTTCATRTRDERLPARCRAGAYKRHGKRRHAPTTDTHAFETTLGESTQAPPCTMRRASARYHRAGDLSDTDAGGSRSRTRRRRAAQVTRTTLPDVHGTDTRRLHDSCLRCE
jgi:hypothetical protein